jgi:nucleoside-diphosphate-sugar epimerase
MPVDLQQNPGLTTLEGTLADPPWEGIRAFHAGTCLHTAWITTPGIFLESPANDQFLAWSIAFAEKFFALGGQHFVGLGSCAEYLPAHRPLKESESPLNQSSRYARCKNALREALEALAHQTGKSAAWGRVFYPFGIGEHPARLCSSLVLKIARGEAVALKTPESTKDYIYIEDLASAMLTVVERRFQGTINLGTGKGIAVREIARQLGACLKRPELVVEAPVGEADPLDYMVADASVLRGLGWNETVGFEPGLRRLCEHLLATNTGVF